MCYVQYRALGPAKTLAMIGCLQAGFPAQTRFYFLGSGRNIMYGIAKRLIRQEILPRSFRCAGTRASWREWTLREGQAGGIRALMIAGP